MSFTDLSQRKRALFGLFGFVSALARLGFIALAAFVRLLADAAIVRAEAADSSGAADHNDPYGIQNYRTGNLDAGDDPHGWYRNS